MQMADFSLKLIHCYQICVLILIYPCMYYGCGIPDRKIMTFELGCDQWIGNANQESVAGCSTRLQTLQAMVLRCAGRDERV